ncbi:hypothetical protein M406DRAFT_334388 [Cryphonectria parasitica EP155]|uniref:Rhodopsin domain-containing protein n=1 Tax=Cryphonectria parasitica (strain ATCC 38755 / EP155) TaxID=660469 RepID=A0A9P4XTU5_CRYP1|nr:uncharacterized protein M406DRAFT_334388 [Cryphonectria parasitica EP155]KAF3760771.1 hypothetical protein M406DRAFT_334388 [Cryphonectria parasitica EP155]
MPQPVWSVDPDFWTAAIIVFIIQTAFFSLRITARMIGLGKWGWDDWTCIVAYAILVAQFIMCMLIGHYGDYNNYWTLDFANLPPFWRIDFARAVLYALCLGLCKASIICLYQRIFEGPRLWWVFLATQLFNALLALSYFVSAFFVARPFSCNFVLDLPADCKYDDVWDGSGAYSAVNAAFDVWLVVIPAVVVWRLQMRTGRKASVVAVFATGILTCLVAVLRFVLYRLQGDPDTSDYTYQSLIWATYYAYYAELTSCFAIACLPAIRQLVGKKIWPVLKTGFSVLSSTWSRSRTRTGSSSIVLSARDTDPAAGGSGGKWLASSSSSSKRQTRTTIISSPLDGSFQHLTSHLQEKEEETEVAPPRLKSSGESVSYAV